MVAIASNRTLPWSRPVQGIPVPGHLRRLPERLATEAIHSQAGICSTPMVESLRYVRSGARIF